MSELFGDGVMRAHSTCRSASAAALWSGARFVTSGTRSITVELKTSNGWHRFWAVTPTRLHWIAGS